MRTLSVAKAACDEGFDVTIASHFSEEALVLAGQLAPDASLVSLAGDDTKYGLQATINRIEPHIVHSDTYEDGFSFGDGNHLKSNAQDGAFGARPADLAIDGNFGAEQSFVNRFDTRFLLVGASASQIRDQVTRRRGIERMAGSRARLLVVLGGTDPFGVTTRVVQTLATYETPLEISIISPPDQKRRIEAILRGSHHQFQIHDFLVDLPGVASEHDAVISAAGTSTWDFCCMGVPALLVCVTDNQYVGFKSAVDAGLAFGVDARADRDFASELLAGVAEVVNEAAIIHKRAATGMKVFDGLGTWRLVESWKTILNISKDNKSVHFDRRSRARGATVEDASDLLNWRNDPETRKYSRSQDVITFGQHVAWLEKVIADPERHLLVVEAGAEKLGTVRWDHESDEITGFWEVSITVAPRYRGQGVSAEMLRAAEEWLHDREGTGIRLVAYINEGNIASQKLFARAGYLPFEPVDATGFSAASKII